MNRNRVTEFGRAAIAMAALMMMAGPVSAQGMAPQGPAEVGVITLAAQEVPRIYTLPGRAVAQEEVAIRPRVGGVITAILYQPGKPVAQGAEMFRIDPTTYEAAKQGAEANLTSAQAAVPKAQAAYDRARKLVGSGSTQVDVESAQATLEQAKAAVLASESALKQAQAELSWTTVTSPLDGMASVASVSVGDLVTAGQADALATVTRLNPIEVDMYEPSARLQRLRDDIDSGRIKVSDKVKVVLTLENGSTYSALGELVAPGFKVSTTTGSIDFRYRFDNAEYRILPGMFLRGQIEIGSSSALIVPQLAASRGRDGQLTAWVAKDGKAEKRVLAEDGTSGSGWIVTDGVSAGDQLIVNGMSNLGEGAEVKTVPAYIDADGVVRDGEAPAADAAAPDTAPDPSSDPATNSAAKDE